MLLLLLFGSVYFEYYAQTLTRRAETTAFVGSVFDCGWYHFQTLLTLSVQKIFTQPPHSNTGVTQRAFECF